MDLTLTTKYARSDGVFSTLCDSIGSQIAWTLEHAYPDGNGGFVPKIPRPGVYKCIRGMHSLEHYNKGQPLETFMLLGVEGHSGILFHVGNFNRDSDGCILLGDELQEDSSQWWINGSRLTFAHFMKLQTGCDSFKLTVR